MPHRRFRGCCAARLLLPLTTGLALLSLITAGAIADSEPASASTAKAPAWTGPETDFREVDGHIIGPWWQGGGPGALYFTGPHAQRHKSFEQVGRAVAEKTGRPYLEIHKEHLWPSDADANGVLVYPDGTARAQLFIMPGGNSFYNMCDIAGISELTPEKATAERQKFVEARKIPQAAFKTGMNYVGACGGFFTATSGYDVKGALYASWGLWPGKVKNIGPNKRTPFPDVVFDPARAEHPLVKATNGGTLKNMYYNGGPLGVLGDVPDT